MKNKPILIFNAVVALAAFVAFLAFLPKIRGFFAAFYGEGDSPGAAPAATGPTIVSPQWFVWVPLLVLCGAGVTMLGFVLPRRGQAKLAMRAGAAAIACVFVFLLVKLFAPLLDAAKKLVDE